MFSGREKIVDIRWRRYCGHIALDADMCGLLGDGGEIGQPLALRGV